MKAAIIVYANHAFCSDCGKETSPFAMDHDCGAVFEALMLGENKADEQFAEDVQLLRPDLPVVEYMT